MTEETKPKKRRLKKPQWDKLPRKKITDMYAAYREQQSAAYISRKTGVAKSTAKRYIDKYNWEDRLRKYHEYVAKLADQQLAERQASNLSIVQGAIAQINLEIEAGLIEGKYTDIDKLIRLEQHLSGVVDKKEEININVNIVKDEEGE